MGRENRGVFHIQLWEEDPVNYLITGDLYMMDLCETHTQVLSTINGENIGYAHQGELCLVLQIKPNHVQFLTSRGILGWIHRSLFYPQELPGD